VSYRAEQRAPREGAKIAVGGFLHETNTFAPTATRFQDFAQPGGWLGLVRGPELFEALTGINLAASGFIEAARSAGNSLVPLLWCEAGPSGLVERETYERISGQLLADLAAAQPVDAVYLDLHGAMVTAHLEDGEGELLRRLRELLGPSVPILASLDLHANVTDLMLESASLMVAYRTYPHVDMAETGRRVALQTDRLLAGPELARSLRKLPFLIPIPWQCTTLEPAASIYRLLERIEQRPSVISVSLAMGFPPADIGECGPAVLVYAEDQASSDAGATELEAAILKAETGFAGQILEADAAVIQALRLLREKGGPVLLADTQDNPGAGSTGDTTGVLEALIRQQAEGAVIGLVWDPDLAALAHAAGVGATVDSAIGGRSGPPGQGPLSARFKVLSLGDGNFTATGPFYMGARMQLGPMALLETGGVRILVSTQRQQAADQAMFRHLGVEPVSVPILALKSSVHFRADFEPIASEVLIVASPGHNPVDHTKLAYRRLRAGVRLMPMGPEFQPR
jgi:microcystin degradation protein MlrC